MYSIGRFSKICNIPVKTLRYYNDIGLFKPSYIDPQTNYRYYDYEKIDVIKKILLLKSCQIPLATIKELIERCDPELWKGMIEEKISDLEKHKEQISKQIVEMKQLKLKMEANVSIIPGPLLSDCFIENRKDILVYTLRKKINIKFIDMLVKNLFDQIYAFNLEVNGNLMAIFHERDLNQNEADVELLIPIKDSNKIDGCKILASGIYASIQVKGSYTELALGYEMLNKWITEQNLIQDGNMIEIYEKGLVPTNINLRDLKPNLNIHPTDFITKICVPVTKSDV